MRGEARQWDVKTVEGLSFSIILETENLANADFNGLVKSIESLAQQDPPPTCANEVLLIDSGDTPTELLDRLCQQYAWIKVHEAPPGTGYYASKMLGATLATGDIIVYYDSDCIYEPTWLRTMLTSFSHASAPQIIAGETTTRGVGPYETAMSMTYIFPQYSGQKTLIPSSQYFLNNVAFRRSFLLANPIPTDLPLYRGNCVIHAQELSEKAYTIWRQPQARATHAPPNGLSHFFWRFLLIGHDYYWQKRILRARGFQKVNDPAMSSQGKIQIFSDRIRKLFKNDLRHAIFFPFAIPIMIASAILIYMGYFITAQNPKYLLETYSKILDQSESMT
ncbi:glycosyltransferase [Phormidesmis sp. 146-35]